MKRSKPTYIFKKIIFIEFVLIFSLLSAYAISAVIQRTSTDPSSITSNRPFQYLFDHYRGFKRFQALPGGLFNPPKPAGKKKTLAKKSSTVTMPPPTGITLVDDIKRLQTVEALLKRKLYRNAQQLLDGANQPHEYLEPEQAKLTLQLLYFQQQYAAFLETYKTRAPAEQKENLQVQLLRINCLVKTGSKDEAFHLFKQLFMSNRLRPFRDLLSASTLKEFLQKMTYDDWFLKFMNLVEQNHYTEYTREKPYSRSPQLHNLVAAEFSYKRKRYTAAQRLLASVKSPLLLAHKKKILLKIEIRRKHYDAIAPGLQELEDEDAPEVYTRVLFDAASILLIHRELDRSLLLFEEYLRRIEKGTSADQRDSDYWKAQWLTAWIHVRRDNKKEALRYFKAGSLSPMNSYKVANSYWMQRLGRRQPNSLEHFPYSFYYTRSRDSRRGPFETSLQPFIALLNGPRSPRFNQYLEDLESLVRNGLLPESFAFIRWAKQQSRLNPSEQNALKIIEAIFYLKKNDFYHAFVTFRRNFDNYQSLRLPRFLGGIYSPVRYEPLIDTYSQAHDVDKYLVMALIKQESFFRPHIVSPARANGLMQLLYSTARFVARGQGLRITKWDLYKPEVNINLGTDYLKGLLDKYNGKNHLALAAYNAGEHRVDAWLRSFGDVSDDIFIEMIPFTETRNYVKKVLRNYYYYKFYHGRI